MKKLTAYAAAVAAICVLVAAPAADAARAAPVAEAISSGAQVDTMLRLINSGRRSAGLPRLRSSPTLARAARFKLARIAACGEFSHTPCGARFTATFRAAGWRGGMIGENIACGGSYLGSPPVIFRSWMSSPGHRANIMRRSFHREGLAVGTVVLPRAGRVRLWVNTFGA
jgi:uncharacterized protein YkwD